MAGTSILTFIPQEPVFKYVQFIKRKKTIVKKLFFPHHLFAIQCYTYDDYYKGIFYFEDIHLLFSNKEFNFSKQYKQQEVFGLPLPNYFKDFFVCMGDLNFSDKCLKKLSNDVIRFFWESAFVKLKSNDDEERNPNYWLEKYTKYFPRKWANQSLIGEKHFLDSSEIRTDKFSKFLNSNRQETFYLLKNDVLTVKRFK